MTRPVIGEITSHPPAAGHRITFARLDGSRSLDLVELYEQSGRVAAGLRALGLRRGDRVGVLASNCPEWVLLDLAALRLGLVTAGFEPGKFAPGEELLARYELSLLFTDRPFDAAGIRPIDEVGKLAEAAAAPPPPPAWGPREVTTIKFTSGSTGEPKGLGATAGSIDSSISAVQELFSHGPGDDLFLFLPLSLLQQRYWIYSALCFGHDVTVSTYEAAFAALARSRPTVVMGVPAFFEAALKQVDSRARRGGAAGGDPLTARRAAAAGLFGDRIRYLWTGSAPARPAMLAAFEELGLPIYEGYGLNEACIVAKNAPGARRAGSVGRVLAGKQVLIGEDGVISVRSEHPVNTRYEYAPAGESERMFGPDGTVRTGDLGHLDEDGFLFLHGRADDVIVLDNGRKVIVRPIEEALRAGGAIAECVVFCPSQTSLVAVVSPAASPADEAAVAADVARANAALSPDERIAGVVVAREPFGVGNGLLTSQGKPRRGRILAEYRSEIDAAALRKGT